MFHFPDFGDSGVNGRPHLDTFYPSCGDLSEKGIFILEEGADANLCVKLPLLVDKEETKIKILEDHIASVRYGSC